jgi:hypothetical protein
LSFPGKKKTEKDEEIKPHGGTRSSQRREGNEENGDHRRDPSSHSHSFLSDMNTEKWMKKRRGQGQNNQRRQLQQESQGTVYDERRKGGRLVDWIGSLPSPRKKSEQDFSDQRTRTHNEFGDELGDEKYGTEEESTYRISRVPGIQGIMKSGCKEHSGQHHEKNVKEGDSKTNSLQDSSHNQKKKPLRILQITDIHFDPYFSPGSKTDCGEPVCCRSNNGPASTPSSMAGMWGDYMECDTPYFTVENSLQRIHSAHPDVDVWFMTGDLPPHDIWEYNRNETLAHIRFTSWLIDQYSRDTPVLPVIGNHEAVPINR